VRGVAGVTKAEKKSNGLKLKRRFKSGSGVDRGAIASLYHLVHVEHKPASSDYNALLPWSVVKRRGLEIAQTGIFWPWWADQKKRKPLAAAGFGLKKSSFKATHRPAAAKKSSTQTHKTKKGLLFW